PVRSVAADRERARQGAGRAHRRHGVAGDTAGAGHGPRRPARGRRARPHARADAAGGEGPPRDLRRGQRRRSGGDRGAGRANHRQLAIMRLLNAAIVALALLATLGGFLQEKKRLATILALPPAAARALYEKAQLRRERVLMLFTGL